MPRRCLRPCIHPGCPMLTQRERCMKHESEHQALRNASRPQYQGGWAKLSRAAREAEPWCHCTRPGCHGTRDLCAREDDLTFDHETARPECRSCNSRHRRNVGEVRVPDVIR